MKTVTVEDRETEGGVETPVRGRCAGLTTYVCISVRGIRPRETHVDGTFTVRAASIVDGSGIRIRCDHSETCEQMIHDRVS